MTEFPTPGDYAQAIQNPERAFLAPGLQRSVFPLPAGQVFVMPSTGSNAVVFRARVGGKDEAFRFFTSETSAGTRARYDALNAVIRENRELDRYLPQVQWVDRGIRVGDRTWPMLRMDWLDGDPLDDRVEDLVERGDTAGVAALGGRWRALVSRMQTQRFAHGDLQHGNVFVDRRGELHLIDFDGIWTPALQGTAPPQESGHPCYQPPSAGGERWQRWMDTFPAVVINLSLTVVSHDPSAWRFYRGNNLLFSKDDFDPPFSTEVWRHLARMTRVPDIDRQATFLMEACRAGWVPDVGFDEVLGIAPPAPPVDSALPWWEQTAGNRVDVPGPRPSADADRSAPWREKVLAGPARVKPSEPPPPGSSPFATPGGGTPRSPGHAAGQWQWPTPQVGAPTGPTSVPQDQEVEKEKKSGAGRGVAIALGVFIVLMLIALVVVGIVTRA